MYKNLSRVTVTLILVLAAGSCSSEKAGNQQRSAASSAQGGPISAAARPASNEFSFGDVMSVFDSEAQEFDSKDVGNLNKWAQLSVKEIKSIGSSPEYQDLKDAAEAVADLFQNLHLLEKGGTKVGKFKSASSRAMGEFVTIARETQQKLLANKSMGNVAGLNKLTSILSEMDNKEKRLLVKTKLRELNSLISKRGILGRSTAKNAATSLLEVISTDGSFKNESKIIATKAVQDVKNIAENKNNKDADVGVKRTRSDILDEAFTKICKAEGLTDKVEDIGAIESRIAKDKATLEAGVREYLTNANFHAQAFRVKPGASFIKAIRKALTDIGARFERFNDDNESDHYKEMIEDINGMNETKQTRKSPQVVMKTFVDVCENMGVNTLSKNALLARVGALKELNDDEEVSSFDTLHDLYRVHKKIFINNCNFKGTDTDSDSIDIEDKKARFQTLKSVKELAIAIKKIIKIADDENTFDVQRTYNALDYLQHCKKADVVEDTINVLSNDLENATILDVANGIKSKYKKFNDERFINLVADYAHLLQALKEHLVASVPEIYGSSSN